MKKKILITICVCMGLIGVYGVFASQGILPWPGNIQAEDLRVLEETRQTLQTEETQRKNIAENILANQEGLDKFAQLVQVLDATVENPVTYNEILYNYKYIEKVYRLSETQLDSIADYIIQGADAEDILGICYFWLDTNEDIGLIGDIYAQKSEFCQSEYWIEDAFNKVTQNKCGVLTADEIKDYLQQGCTKEEIGLANKLCRKGIFTIQEILNKVLEGKSFAVIQNEMAVMNSNVPVLHAAESVDAGTFALSEETARLSGEDADVYINAAAEGADLEVVYEEKKQGISREIIQELKSAGVYKAIPENSGQGGDLS